MHRLPLCVACVLFPLAAAAQVLPPPPPPPASPAAQPPRDRPAAEPTGTAVLAGRVLSAETGKPLRRVRVQLRAPVLSDLRVTSTDANGAWRVTQLPPGRYTITASKGGYATVNFGQKRPFEPGTAVDLADGARLDKLDLYLPRGSVITGRIVDEFGEPVAGLNISAQRYYWATGVRRLMSASGLGSSDTTDDLGQYRLHGLPPADYFVVGGRPIQLSAEKTDERTDYAMTYYPGTALVSEAQRVTLGEGQEATVSFALARIRVATVSGIATSSDGKPIANGMVSLIAANPQGGAPMRNVALVKPDGTFLITNVIPGDYVLQTTLAADLERLASTGSTGSIRNAEVALLPVTVTGSDISGLVLVSQPTASARGRLVLDGGLPTGVVSAAFSVSAAPASPDYFLMGGSARVRDDWTFDLPGLVGRRLLRVSAPAGWFLKSAIVGDTDVTDTPLELRPGENLSGLEVTLTRTMSALSGSVQTPRGTPATDYVVVAFSPDTAKWGYQTRFVKAGRPDASGTFRIEGLPAADYLVAVVEYLEPGEEGDPEVLERLRAAATAVKLDDGESRTLVLKMK